MDMANQDNTTLTHPEVIRTVDYLIKINQKIASSTGCYYTFYLKRIFKDLINVYRLYSAMVNGDSRLDKAVKQMRQARRDILKLI